MTWAINPGADNLSASTTLSMYGIQLTNGPTSNNILLNRLELSVASATSLCEVVIGRVDDTADWSALDPSRYLRGNTPSITLSKMGQLTEEPAFSQVIARRFIYGVGPHIFEFPEDLEGLQDVGNDDLIPAFTIQRVDAGGSVDFNLTAWFRQY